MVEHHEYENPFEEVHRKVKALKDRNREVLLGDLALAGPVEEERVRAQLEGARASAGLDRGGRRHRRPVDVGDLLQ